jgi:2-polyprenyl-3-methyl-5-hydroxy-6-metoxy-1,4-benzoquinol methylase
VPANAYVQQNQPPGVPPLTLTGERTLPDVPAENYWYRRHLAVYEWIADRVEGKRVLDMACGEGYGSNLLANRAAGVVGLDANPEAFEHARLRYRRANLSFDRGMVENYGEPHGFDAVVFLQTIEHVFDPVAVLEHLRSLLTPAGVVYVSTPNVLTLAPSGAAKSGNPWHLKEYTAEEFRGLCRAAFEQVELLGVFHARKLRAHELALKLGWDAVHARLRITKPFYERFTPAIATSDFALRVGGSASLDAALDFLAVCRLS